MNLNRFTNIASTITAVLSAVTAGMASLLHCSSTGDLAATCTGDLLPAKYMIIASGVFGVLTFILKMIRPGGPLASLFGATAVVVPPDKAAPGVVTKAQVASK